jgi:hypothetical protein
VAALTKAAKDAALRRSGFEKELTDAQETIKVGQCRLTVSKPVLKAPTSIG